MTSDFFDFTMLNMFKELSDDGNDAVKEIISIFLGDAPKYLDQIKAAIAQDDASGLNEAAHSLKSSSANLGATELSQHCQSLENLGRGGTTEGAQSQFDVMENSLKKVKEILEQELVSL